MKEALSTPKLKAIYHRVARRYDFQHACFTAASDQRGRHLLVEKVVTEGDNVLDCGAGTGRTGLMAARKVGTRGKVILLDLSNRMLAVAKEKAMAADLLDRVEFLSGDMHHLPFQDHCFDAALSTYSLCPLRDPSCGALELYRVVRPGGRIGVAHSAEPQNVVLRWLARRIETLVWRFPLISLGCRPVSVLPVLEQAGGKIVFRKHIGMPLWPFIVFIIEKPEGGKNLRTAWLAEA